LSVSFGLWRIGILRTMENRITKVHLSLSQLNKKVSKENSQEDPNASKEEKKHNLEDQNATESAKPQREFPSPFINDLGLLEWHLCGKRVVVQLNVVRGRVNC